MDHFILSYHMPSYLSLHFFIRYAASFTVVKIKHEFFIFYFPFFFLNKTTFSNTWIKQISNRYIVYVNFLFFF